MATALNRLLELRSQLAEELEAHYTSLIESIDWTPWHRRGTAVRASAIAVPIRILKEKATIRTEPGIETDPGHADDEGQGSPGANRPIDPERARRYEEPTGETMTTVARWENEHRRIHRAVILGAPGGGKTFLTHITAIGLAQNALGAVRERRTPLDRLPLPVLVELPKLALVEQATTFQEAVACVLESHPTLRFSSRFSAWLQARLDDPETWLILDALDQVTEPSKLEPWFRQLGAASWRSRVILTCRKHNYDPALLPWRERQQFQKYELAPLDRKRQRELVTTWFRDDRARSKSLLQALSHNSPLADTASNPNLLTLACLAHGQNPSSITRKTRRVDLYHLVIRDLIRGAYQHNPLPPQDPRIDDVLQLLKRVARRLFEHDPSGNLFTYRLLTSALEEECGSSSEARDVRDELLKRAVLVNAGLSPAGRRETQFSFLHRSVLEYLTACALYDEVRPDPFQPVEAWSRIERKINAKAWKPDWREVIAFIAGLFDDPGPLLSRLADESLDDDYRHRLALAGYSLGETRTEWRATEGGRELIAAITDDAFMIWWDKFKLGIIRDVVEHFTEILPVLDGVSASVMKVETPCQKLCRFLQGGCDSRYAAEVLGAIGSVEAIPSLIYALAKDADSSVRADAAKALGAIGAVEAIPSLIHALKKGRTYEIRSRAAEALGTIGSVEAIPNLIGSLQNDRHASVRDSAAMALGAIESSKGMPSLIQAILNGTDDLSRTCAVKVLGEIESSEGVPSLLDALQNDTDDRVRARAARGLSAIRSAEAVPRLIHALQHDTGDEVRIHAAKALGAIGATEALPSLVHARLNDPNHEVQRAVVGALSSIDSVERVLNLIRILENDTDEWVRTHAAKELGTIEPSKAIHSLTRTLRHDTSEWVRAQAAKALGAIGSVDTVPDLIHALRNDADAWVRSNVVEALGAIGSSKAIPSLIHAFRNDTDDAVRRDAAVALGALGSAEAVPVLIQDLQTGKYSLRSIASEALGTLRSAEAIPSLIHALRNDSHQSVREHAARALGAIRSSEAIPALIHALQGDRHHSVRDSAAKALSDIESAEAVPSLIHALQHDKEGWVRRFASHALSHLMRKGFRFRKHSDEAWAIRNISDLEKSFEAGLWWAER